MCQGTTYTHWGSANCGSGYQRLYSGFVAAMLGRWTGPNWAAGGPPLCLNEAAGSNWTDSNVGLVVRAKGSEGNDRVEFQDEQSILCAVCF